MEYGTIVYPYGYRVPPACSSSSPRAVMEVCPKNNSTMSGGLFGGAGALVRVDEPNGDAYLVSPAAHIGRVVTGVVLLSETSGAASSSSSPVARLGGLASVAFADKLAEQGYKVLVIEAASARLDAAAAVPAWGARAEQAAAFLRQHHDIQRVALLGYGAGADVAIHMAVASSASVAFDCFVVLSPDGRAVVDVHDHTNTAPLPPTLVLVGGKTPFARSDTFQQLIALYERNPPTEPGPLPFRSRVFPDQTKGFAFSGITDEDAATLAIAEILDWLVLHLHRFRTAACTSDTDPWWPQGRNGPFCNVGQKTWQETRNAWLTATVARPPRPPAVPSHLLFDGLSSMRRTFDLPHRMALGDVVELFVEIWEVQQ